MRWRLRQISRVRIASRAASKQQPLAKTIRFAFTTHKSNRREGLKREIPRQLNLKTIRGAFETNTGRLIVDDE